MHQRNFGKGTPTFSIEPTNPFGSVDRLGFERVGNTARKISKVCDVTILWDQYILKSDNCPANASFALRIVCHGTKTLAQGVGASPLRSFAKIASFRPIYFWLYRSLHRHWYGWQQAWREGSGRHICCLRNVRIWSLLRPRYLYAKLAKLWCGLPRLR